MHAVSIHVSQATCSKDLETLSRNRHNSPAYGDQMSSSATRNERNESAYNVQPKPFQLYVRVSSR